MLGWDMKGPHGTCVLWDAANPPCLPLGTALCNHHHPAGSNGKPPEPQILHQLSLAAKDQRAAGYQEVQQDSLELQKGPAS